MRKSSAEKSGKIQIHNIILNFLALDFLVHKIKEWEIQNSFCHSLPYFSIYPEIYVSCHQNIYVDVSIALKKISNDKSKKLDHNLNMYVWCVFIYTA